MHAEHAEDKVPAARPGTDEETVERLVGRSGLELGPDESFGELNVVGPRNRGCFDCRDRVQPEHRLGA